MRTMGEPGEATAENEGWPTTLSLAAISDTLSGIGAYLGIDADWNDIHRAARSLLRRKDWVDNEGLLRALEQTAQRFGISFTRSSNADTSSLLTPFVALTSGGQPHPWVVVLERGPKRQHVMGRGWIDESAFAQLVGTTNPLTVLHASPQAPWAALAQGPGASRFGSRVLSLLKLERDDLAAVFIFAVAVGLLSLATPIAVQAVVSSVAYAGMLQPLFILSVFLFTALGLASGLRALQARVVELIERRLLVRTALDFSWRFVRLAPQVRRDKFGPHVANRFFEVVTLQKTAYSLLIDGVAVSLQAGTGLLLMAFYHPYLLAFGLVLTLLVAALMLIPWHQGLKTAYKESSEKYAVAEWLEELSRVPHVFQGHTVLKWVEEQTQSRVRRWLRARADHFSISFTQMASALALHAVVSTLLLAVGGALVMKNQLTLGQLVAAELVVTSVTDALVKLGSLLNKAYDFTISVEKVASVVDLALERTPEGAVLPKGSGGKKLDAVALKLGNGDGWSFSAEPGSRNVLIESHGPTRHRLAQVFAGHDLPQEGALLLDGVDTRRADLQDIRDRVAWIQPAGIFEGTLFDNIAVGRPGIGVEQVNAALATVGGLELVRSLPGGLDTQLSAAGHPLSFDHQIQVLVARALASKPRLLVTEDFFDAVSPRVRDECVKAITQTGEHTLIAVSADEKSNLAKHCRRVENLA